MMLRDMNEMFSLSFESDVNDKFSQLRNESNLMYLISIATSPFWSLRCLFCCWKTFTHCHVEILWKIRMGYFFKHCHVIRVDIYGLSFKMKYYVSGDRSNYFLFLRIHIENLCKGFIEYFQKFDKLRIWPWTWLCDNWSCHESFFEKLSADAFLVFLKALCYEFYTCWMISRNLRVMWMRRLVRFYESDHHIWVVLKWFTVMNGYIDW